MDKSRALGVASSVFICRFGGFVCVATQIDAVLTHHIPYDSWIGVILLAMGAGIWTFGDLILLESSPVESGGAK